MKRKLESSDEALHGVLPCPKRVRIEFESESESATSSLCITGLSRPNTANKLQQKCASILSEPQVVLVWMNPVCSLAVVCLDTVHAARTLKAALKRENPNLRVNFVQIAAQVLQSVRSLPPCSASNFVIPDQGRKFDRFFDATPTGLLMDRDSFYLMTPRKESIEIVEWIADLTHNKMKLIVDASAGIGGNSYAFARDNRVDRVYSVEINSVRFTALISNVLAMDLNKIVPIYDDFVEWMRSNEFTNLDKSTACVFVDPPWGGPTYKNIKVIEDLPLSNKDGTRSTGLTAICTELLSDVPCIVLKLPFNFDFTGFTKRLRASLAETLRIETLPRGNIVFIAVIKE